MQNKAAVILWLYHTDLANEFIELLKPHKKYIDIFLGLCIDNDNNYTESLFKDVFGKSVHIDHFINAGADVLPTINLLEKCYNYPYLFKLHSKKNNWGINNHVNWRVLLSNDILHKDNFHWTLDRLKQDHIGIVGSKAMIMRDNEYTNSQHIIRLSNMLDIDHSKLRIKSFIGGNVFAIKTKLLLPFMNRPDLKNLLSKETGLIKDDNGGTYAHSMERLFGYMAEYNNKTICGVPCKTDIILSPRLKQRRLHLVKLYNNSCYIQENVEIYGNIINEDKFSITIQWLNKKSHPQTYKQYSKYLLNTNAIT